MEGPPYTYVTLCNLSLCFWIMKDLNVYLHFCQRLKTLEQIFRQSLQIIVGQTPGREEENTRYFAYCLCFTRYSVCRTCRRVLLLYMYICRSICKWNFKCRIKGKVIYRICYAVFPSRGYLLKSLDTSCHPGDGRQEP